MKYYIKSNYCGTLVDNVERTELEADKYIDELNREAQSLGHYEVTFSKLNTNELSV